MDSLDWVHAIAGLLVFSSVSLGYFFSPWWFLLTAFVGLNLFQFGFSGFCPLQKILERFGVMRR